ncbi:hypothetical protein A8C32_03925 [Flavivirga aquatica]|uniref:Uncharacterized protein n=1 Tax=Flavivirga aquatica TaxID=1849968 RepID=A0A1E5TBA4_9FLAO|nr:hypothetical protein [Flavivirga aquatica]OEK08607.1 hypothetical protein A8C32_03925 [Flavivirga aquatica]
MSNYLKIIFLFLFIACGKIKKETVKIALQETNFPVYAILSNDTNRIVRVCFPKEIKIENISSSEKSFIKINYKYNSISTPIGNFIKLYKNKNEVLEKISNNKKKNILSKKAEKYILYTVHYIDESTFFTNQFQSYNEKLLAEHKDTLHIGTVS